MFFIELLKNPNNTKKKSNGLKSENPYRSITIILVYILVVFILQLNTYDHIWNFHQNRIRNSIFAHPFIRHIMAIHIISECITMSYF